MRIVPVAPLLLLQFVLLAGFLGISVMAGSPANAASVTMIFAGMLGVSAMAVQNALVRISFSGIPSTAVMTINATTFSMDLIQILSGTDADELPKARARFRQTGPALAGFIMGCAVAAAGETRFGLTSLIAPVVFAAIALMLGTDADRTRRRI